mmetsp:Transcript_13982/g.55396  ORF Transcript_13982/g.55396 Transcript_13982/m.55396 type:complete len:214 (+) Transcript_13982:339-980(+)
MPSTGYRYPACSPPSPPPRDCILRKNAAARSIWYSDTSHRAVSRCSSSRTSLTVPPQSRGSSGHLNTPSSLAARKSDLNPTKNTLFRLCGTQPRASNTRVPTAYPTDSNAATISAIVSPSSIVTNPSTFSSTNALGSAATRTLRISRNSCPRGSPRPSRSPRRLKDWHGNPPVSTSCGGINVSHTSVISPQQTSGGRASVEPSSPHDPPWCAR